MFCIISSSEEQNIKGCCRGICLSVNGSEASIPIVEGRFKVGES